MIEAGARKVINIRGRSLTAKEKHMLADHEERIEKLETNVSIVQDIADTVAAIKRYIKVYGPIVATAAISSGIVSGEWGAFLKALLS